MAARSITIPPSSSGHRIWPRYTKRPPACTCSRPVLSRGPARGSGSGRLLTAIASQQLDVPYEVILVDSGSQNDTRPTAGSFGATVCRIAPDDFTFDHALYLGISAPRGEFVLFISAHCYREHTRWLAEMLQPFVDTRVALVYGRQRGNRTTKFSEHRVFDRWFPDESKIKQQRSSCSNANAAVRKAEWEEQLHDGGLTRFEEIAWARVVIERGHLLAYNGGPGVIHVHDEPWRQVFRRYRRSATAFAPVFPANGSAARCSGSSSC